MGSQQPKSVRLAHPTAGRSLTSDFHVKDGGYQKRSRLSLGGVLESIWRRFASSSEGFRNMRKHLSFKHVGDQSAKKSEFWKTILDPQQPFLQQWNKIFVLSCVLAVAVDPLFFYIPVIDGQHKCLTMDRPILIIACVLRSFIDIFYLLHMIFKFRTGFVAPSSLVFGRGDLVEDPGAIAKRYLSSYFIIDILSILPLPQFVLLVIIPALKGPIPLRTKHFIKIVILSQYVPRLLRIYPLYREVTRTSGILTETAWSGAAFNLLIYMLASHVVGAIWYLLAVEQEERCWLEGCEKNNCDHNLLYCGEQHRPVHPFIDKYCPHKEPDDEHPEMFHFGMYIEAIKFRITESRKFRGKFFYSFWWALRNVGSSGQNLPTSTYLGELFFAMFIAVLGLVLFALLISNIQKYLQSTTARIEQMRINRRDAEHWMAHRMLPEDLRQRIRRYDQYKWQLNRGVQEEELISNLPKDLRRDIKRHLCLALLQKVPLFKGMDKQLLDAMSEYLKPVLFTEKSFIMQEGDPIDMMLFIMRGKLATIITYGGKTGFFNKDILKAGDFCGEELVPWAMDLNSTFLPTSTRTVESLTEVEAFALKANELQSVARQFQYLHGKQLQLTVRFYSHQWKIWAAYKIQEAWHDYCDRKRKKNVLERDDRFQDALAKTIGASASFGATLYASIFISHLLHAVHLKNQQTTQLSPVITVPPSPKPDKPDFTILDI